jgi:hypothetical protein
VTRIEVHLVGQGGNTSNNDGNGNGGPGGAGGYCIGIYDVSATATATVTIPVTWDGSGYPGNQDTTFPSIFAIAGGATMSAGAGGYGGLPAGSASGGTATGGMLNFAGEAGYPSHEHGSHSRFGGDYGDGAKYAAGDLGVNGYAGRPGYCYIKEYSDASAYLVGDKFVSMQVFGKEVEQQSAPLGGADQTWTKPAGITRIEVFCVGGGGASTNTGGRAGGGAFARKSYDVTNVTSYPLVIGLPGRFGVAPGNGRGGGSHFNATGGTQISPTGPDMVHAPGGVETGGSADAAGGSWGSPVLGGGDLRVEGSHGTRGGDAGGPYGGEIGRGAVGGSGFTDGGTGIVVVYEYSDPSLVSGGSLVPTGVLNPYAGATAPAGWLLCWGQAISRTVYSKLFTAIGTTYGVGDGSTTFLLPDMRGRVAAGQDDMGGTSANRITGLGSESIDGDVLGSVGGREDFWYSSSGSPNSGNASANGAWADQTPSGGGVYGTIQPTLILNYIIKT